MPQRTLAALVDGRGEAEYRARPPSPARRDAAARPALAERRRPAQTVEQGEKRLGCAADPTSTSTRRLWPIAIGTRSAVDRLLLAGRPADAASLQAGRCRACRSAAAT